MPTSASCSAHCRGYPGPRSTPATLHGDAWSSCCRRCHAPTAAPARAAAAVHGICSAASSSSSSSSRVWGSCHAYTPRTRCAAAVAAAAALDSSMVQQQQQQQQQQAEKGCCDADLAQDPLTAALAATRTLPQLQQVVEQHAAHMSADQLVAAIKQLRRLALTPAAAAATSGSGWLTAAPFVETPPPLPPPPQQRRQPAAAPGRGSLQQQQQPGGPPLSPGALADVLLQQLLALSPTAVDDQHLVTPCYNLGRLQHRSQHLPALLAALQPRLPRLTPQQLSNTIWALATVAQPGQPGAAWADAFLAASAAALPASTSQGQANTVWALGRLGVQPTDAWWTSFWAASRPLLAAARPGELAQVIHGCGRVAPPGGAPPAWSEAWLAASGAALRHSTPKELTMSLWGLDGAGVTPHKAWTMQWFLAAQASLDAASPQDLSLWLYCLARLGLKPSPAWLRLYVGASCAALPACSNQDLVTLMWAAASLAWSPPLLYWRACLEQVERRAHGFNGQDFGNVLWAVGKMEGYDLPNASWLPTVLRHSLPLITSMMPVQLANTAWGLGRLLKSSRAPHSLQHAAAGAAPGLAWQHAFTAAVQRHLQAGKMDAGMLREVLAGLEVWGLQRTDARVAEFWRTAQRQLHQLQQQPAQQQPKQQQ